MSAAVRERAAKQALWDAFCAAHGVAAAGVPLFATDADGAVEVFGYGRDGRPVLRRSAPMGEMLVGTVERVLASAPGKAEGVLPLMHHLDAAGRVVPPYVGKVGRCGGTGGVSINVAGIGTDASGFARWGYNPAYHLGDLSTATLPGHAPGKVVRKYQRWATRLFVEAPTAAPRLRLPVQHRHHGREQRPGGRARATSGLSSAALPWPSPSTC